MSHRRLIRVCALALVALLVVGAVASVLLPGLNQPASNPQEVALGPVAEWQEAAFVIDENGGFAGVLLAPSGSGQVIYICAGGDTVEGIARRFAVSPAELAALNGMGAGDSLEAGQQLAIPAMPAPKRQAAPVLVNQPQAPAPVAEAAPAAAVAAPVAAPAPAQAVAPAAAPAAARPLDVANVESRYVVQAGDNLSVIANRYGLSVDRIAASNGVNDPNLIVAGQTLVIPARNAAPAAEQPKPAVVAEKSAIEQPKPALETRPVVAEKPAVEAKPVVAEKPAGAAKTAEQPKPVKPAVSQRYVVDTGDNLGKIAARYGLTADALAAANDLDNPNMIYVGQALTIPTAAQAKTLTRLVTQKAVAKDSQPKQAAPKRVDPEQPVRRAASGGKWIDVNLSAQRLTAYEGDEAVFSTVISSGKPGYDTVVGNYAVYVKYSDTSMRGADYYIPHVPWTMYFYSGYGIHGAPWNNDLGTPHSHGCVNLSVAAARWMFDWAAVGTPVRTHY